MAVETLRRTAEAPPAGRRVSWAFGPGLVFAVAALGPQDLVTHSAAGAAYGYGLLWTLALVILARYALLEATARYVVVTGETLMAGYARAGRWMPLLLLVAMLLRPHLAGLANLLLLESSLALLLPAAPPGYHRTGALAFWGLGFALMYWGRYRWVERVSKPLMILLGGSLAAAALMSRPDLTKVIRGALLPALPNASGSYSVVFLLLALVGSGTGALSNLTYAAFVHEKGWCRPKFLRTQRIDLVLSGAGLLTMGALIQIAAAASLYPTSAPLEELSDLLPMFTAVLGDSGRLVLGLGLWAAVFTTYTGFGTGNGLLAAELWYRVRPSSDIGLPAGAGQTRAYRAYLIWFCLAPLYTLATGWKPLPLVLLQSVVVAFLLPPTVAVLMWLTNQRRLMGRYTSSWVSNTAMTVVMLTTIYLVYRNIAEWLAALSASTR